MKKWWQAVVMSFAVLALQAVAAGDIEAGKAKAIACMACHGEGGNSIQPIFPKLAGQSEGYLFKQLKDYASGARSGAIMSGIVATLDEQDMADLSAYYASTALAPKPISSDLLALGERVYRGGNKETGVPACMACHGPNGLGIPAAKWPALSGQHSAYTAAQLEKFSSDSRHNDANSMMRDIAKRLSAEERLAVSDYISGLH